MIPWSEEDKAKLRQAILDLATGIAIVRVRYDGPPMREVEYQPRNLAEMRALLADMEATSPGAVRRRYVRFSKGFNSPC